MQVSLNMSLEDAGKYWIVKEARQWLKDYGEDINYGARVNKSQYIESREMLEALEGKSGKWIIERLILETTKELRSEKAERVARAKEMLISSIG